MPAPPKQSIDTWLLDLTMLTSTNTIETEKLSLKLWRWFPINCKVIRLKFLSPSFNRFVNRSHTKWRWKIFFTHRFQANFNCLTVQFNGIIFVSCFIFIYRFSNQKFSPPQIDAWVSFRFHIFRFCFILITWNKRSWYLLNSDEKQFLLNFSAKNSALFK